MMEVEDEGFDEVLENGDPSTDFRIHLLTNKQTGDVHWEKEEMPAGKR